MSLRTRHFDCPNCQTTLSATPEDFGQTASCPSCEWAFVVPTIKEGPNEPAVKFFCYHCQTKLSATKRQIGKEIPCANRECRKTLLVPGPDWDNEDRSKNDPGATRPINVQDLIRAGESINRQQ